MPKERVMRQGLILAGGFAVVLLVVTSAAARGGFGVSAGFGAHARPVMVAPRVGGALPGVATVPPALLVPPTGFHHPPAGALRASDRPGDPTPIRLPIRV